MEPWEDVVHALNALAARRLPPMCGHIEQLASCRLRLIRTGNWSFKAGQPYGRAACNHLFEDDLNGAVLLEYQIDQIET